MQMYKYNQQLMTTAQEGAQQKYKRFMKDKLDNIIS